MHKPSSASAFAPPSGMQELGQREFDTISKLLEAKTGIVMTPDKHTLVRARIQRRLRALDLDGFKAYCDYLLGPGGGKEQVAFVNSLTTNLTSFFREPHHFKHLVEAAIAPLVPAVRRGAPLRIWSAGCSTGEEPACIAMMLKSILPEAGRLDVRILATDIDSDVLRKAYRGVYSAQQVDPVPAELKTKFFDRDKGANGMEAYRVNDHLRELVRFKKLNLNAAQWPMRGQFDAIFCRNTLIYFDADRQDEILKRFHRYLKPGGHLYLGHSERLSPNTDPLFTRSGMTIFQALTDCPAKEH
ncbi:MAG: protein-glutamate O-methyltransferase [Litorimonas sp.]